MAAKLEEAVTALVGAMELMMSVNPTPQGAREAVAKAREALGPEVEGGAAPEDADAKHESAKKKQ